MSPLGFLLFVIQAPGQISSPKPCLKQLLSHFLSREAEAGVAILSEEHTLVGGIILCVCFCLFFDLPWNIPQEGSDFLVSVLIIAVLSASAVSP